MQSLGCCQNERVVRFGQPHQILSWIFDFAQLRRIDPYYKISVQISVSTGRQRNKPSIKFPKSNRNQRDTSLFDRIEGLHSQERFAPHPSHLLALIE